MLWWGYLHVNGSLQVKRYFDEIDITEAWESPFVQRVYGPWECTGREDALKHLRMLLVESCKPYYNRR